MGEALRRNQLDAIAQHSTRSGFILDFALKEQKIAIECDGEPWHTSAEALKRDRFRDYILRRDGWVVLRFTGAMIENKIDECISEIMKAL